MERLLEFCTTEPESDDAASREEDGVVVHYLPGQEAALHRPLRLLVASMNAGNEAIALAGDGWIPRGGRLKESPPSLSQQDLGNSPGIYDIIVVGIQEAVLGAKDTVQQGGSIRHHHELTEGFVRHLGDDYSLFATSSRGAMVLVLFASKFAPPIDKIEKSGENTGLGHIFHNKGGLLVQFQIGRTSLSFLSVHLAAHAEHLHRRNTDVSEILWGTRVSELYLDAPSCTHHSFFFGDLNYRLDIPPEVLGLAPETAGHQVQEAQICEILRLIEAKDFANLRKYDQLQQQMTAGKVLQGFSALVPTWEPTYRMQKGQAGVNFDTARVPSYCDRMLYRSMPGCTGCLQLVSFNSAPEVSSSDHKPIASDWLLKASHPEGRARKRLCLERLSTRIHSKVQPVLKVMVFPKKAEDEQVVSKCSRESRIAQAQRDEEAVHAWEALGFVATVGPEDHILIHIWDQNKEWPIDGLVGVVVLPLAQPSVSFREPIIGYGELNGTMEGVLRISSEPGH